MCVSDVRSSCDGMLTCFMNLKSWLGNNKWTNIFSFCFVILGAILEMTVKGVIILLMHIHVVVILLSLNTHELGVTVRTLTPNRCDARVSP